MEISRTASLDETQAISNIQRNVSVEKKIYYSFYCRQLLDIYFIYMQDINMERQNKAHDGTDNKTSNFTSCYGLLVNPTNEIYQGTWTFISWWRHQMEPFSASQALCAGNSPAQRCQSRGALMFSVICAWINDWVNNSEAGVWDATVVIMTSL